MSPIDLLASVPSQAVAVMLALVALAFLAYVPALMAPTPLNRVLRAIRRLGDARSGSFSLAVGGTMATGEFVAGRDAHASVLSMDVMDDGHAGRFVWNADGATLTDGRHLTAKDAREHIESTPYGEAWMQSLLAVVRDGRLHLDAAIRAFISAAGMRVADVRLAATRFVLAGPWRDGLCDLDAIGGTGVAKVRMGDDGITVDAGRGDVIAADWLVAR